MAGHPPGASASTPNAPSDASPIPVDEPLEADEPPAEDPSLASDDPLRNPLPMSLSQTNLRSTTTRRLPHLSR